MNLQEQLIEAIRDDSQTVIREALEQGASLQSRTPSNLTLLEVAQQAGAHNAARYLLERGVSAQVQTQSGDTLLHRAARQGDHGFVCLLLEYGADTEVRDAKNRRPVDVVRPKGGYVHDELLRRSKDTQPTLF